MLKNETTAAVCVRVCWQAGSTFTSPGSVSDGDLPLLVAVPRGCDEAACFLWVRAPGRDAGRDVGWVVVWVAESPRPTEPWVVAVMWARLCRSVGS